MQVSIQDFPAGVIRFASLIHFLFLIIYVVPLYIDVRKLEVVSMISHGRRFLQGLEIAGIMVCTVSTTPQIYLINTYSFGSRVLLALFGIYYSFNQRCKPLDYD